MSTVTFILGLCGSGKSHFARQMMQVRVFDESFFGEKQQELKTALQSGENCAVVEIAFCEAEKRWEIEKELRDVVRSLRINWVCMEKDLEKANQNCRRERKDKVNYDPEAHVRENKKYNEVYSYPEGAIIIKMWPHD